MKIAIWWEQDSWGGVDSHLLTLLRNWPAEGDRFTIFHNASNPGLARISEELASLDRAILIPFPDQVRAADTRFVARFSRSAWPLLVPRTARWAARILAAHGPFDAIVADNGSYPGAWSALAVLRAALEIGIPKRMLLVHHAASPRAPFRASLEHMVDRAVQRWATDLVTVSRATRRTLIDIRDFDATQNPIRVIHNGVDAPHGAPAPGPRLREQFGVPADQILVGMVGRIERYKGHEDLILAFRELPAAVRDGITVLFVGAGTGAELERLARLAARVGVAERVRFAGYVPGDPARVIEQFDLLAMLTKDFEGFGLTLAEAMRTGTPVLATAVGGVPEFVTSEFGLVVPPEAPREVAAALLDFVEHRAEARARAARAHTHIARFSGRAMAEEFSFLLTADMPVANVPDRGAGN